jgi:hypothetical protein
VTYSSFNIRWIRTMNSTKFKLLSV